MFFTIRLKYRGKIYTDDIINKSEASTRNLSARLTVFKSIGDLVVPNNAGYSRFYIKCPLWEDNVSL